MARKKIEEKEKINLAEAISEIKEKFGEGAIMKLREAEKANVDTISTGSLTVDLALGVNGIPRGRITEIYGGESTGKTTLALNVLAEAQKAGGVGAFIDAEHALDPDYAKKIGVNTDDLLISQPDSAEQGLHIVESLVRSGEVDVIVVDSVAALVPKTEVAGEMGELQIGLQARLMSQALRKLSGIVSKTKTVLIFLNQTRMKIGIMFGNPETTPGGLALKFYSSVRIELRRVAQIKQGENIIGSRIKAKIVKNKVAAPFKTAEFDIYYNEGVSRASESINLGSKLGVITKSGSSFVYNGEKIGVGMEKAKEYLKANPKILKEIQKEITQKYND
ncbi:MAG: recombinase RecA [Candidatus Microsyncoccus archaeolyticus]|nr:MAG: recombinase RecA [Candidatus Parcubacteria bacterium]